MNEQKEQTPVRGGWKDYFKDLRGAKCRCGKSKGEGKSFCWTCWKRLPPKLQRALYKRIGEGYEQAFDAAAAHLDEAGCRPSEVC